MLVGGSKCVFAGGEHGHCEPPLECWINPRAAELLAEVLHPKPDHPRRRRTDVREAV